MTIYYSNKALVNPLTTLPTRPARFVYEAVAGVVSEVVLPAGTQLTAEDSVILCYLPIDATVLSWFCYTGILDSGASFAFDVVGVEAGVKFINAASTGMAGGLVPETNKVPETYGYTVPVIFENGNVVPLTIALKPTVNATGALESPATIRFGITYQCSN